jgi:hypothetical protein
MALKPLRIYTESHIDAFMNATAERGGVVSFSSATASGEAMDQSEFTVDYVANPSGIAPYGILMNDVVNYDLTRQRLNEHKDEVQLGSKVTVLSKGVVVTDRIYPGQTPAAGGVAYVGHSGYIASTDVATTAGTALIERRIIGRFLSAKDQDGFAKVQVNLPH